MRKIIGLIILLLSPFTLAAQLSESSYVFKLHGQTRRFTISIIDQKDTVNVNWSIFRNGTLQKGSIQMIGESVEKGTALNWHQPEDGKTYLLPSNETFGIISLEAYQKLVEKSSFTYNGILYKRINDTSSDEGMMHVKAEIDETQMWIALSGKLPVIYEMRDNPLGIDWKIEKYVK